MRRAAIYLAILSVATSVSVVVQGARTQGETGVRHRSREGRQAGSEGRKHRRWRLLKIPLSTWVRRRASPAMKIGGYAARATG